MGWGRGTEIFDQVAEDLIELTTEYNILEEAFPILENLHNLLRNPEWDVMDESKYWEHPTIGKILGNKELN